MATNSAKSNHYVSQCYLEGFPDPTSNNKKLWSYRCYKNSTTISAHLVRIDATAFTNNLYGVGPDERARLEADFGVAEGLYPAIREKVNRRADIGKPALLF